MFFDDAARSFDRCHLWHPYSSMNQPPPVYAVRRACGAEIELDDGRRLVDGMASWWSAIHGYNHPVLNQAAEEQLSRMSHVMFGGLTHEPAVELGRLLTELLPVTLTRIFYADSGSVAVEIALKMALQYWQARSQPRKQRMISLRGGYHGDTFGAMSVCDPVTGMHTLFRGMLPEQLFAPRPSCRFDDDWDSRSLSGIETLLERHAHETAAVILEPVVQGAGGMWFYHPAYLEGVRSLCDRYEILLIYDEIATGFGRSGRLFALEHARRGQQLTAVPDIVCLGKALSGGYVSFAATVTTDKVAEAICGAEPGVFMHGPTFMANPLACALSLASLRLLLRSSWEEAITKIECAIKEGLEPCRALAGVADVRVLGAIGVVELEQDVELAWMQEQFVQRGVWLRPFRRLVYMMPPYISSEEQIATLCRAVCEVIGLQQA